MSASFPQSENLVSWWPAAAPPAQSEIPLQESGDGTHPRIGRHMHVLHEKWGFGQVLHAPTAVDGLVTVEFPDGIHEVSRRSLRRLVPVTSIARMIEDSGAPVTSWTVRKANDQGAIQPDVIGRFAGHKVHYYDVARIPALIRQLSKRDTWTAGTLVTHPGLGIGVIRGYAAENTRGPQRIVTFFNYASALTVPVQELRRLVPGHVVARYVGANRRSFPRLAALRGIYPDFIASGGRIREFYEESRIEDIRKKWNVQRCPDKWTRGRIGLDADGEIVRIETRDARGQVRVREHHLPGVCRAAEVTSLHELVSLRELARNEQMSRYKLNRLLAAAEIKPVCQNGKTLYFDRAKAHAALQQQLDHERQALTLQMLATRTGVSEAILAKKIRTGIVRTLGHHAAHHIAAAEADRIQQVLQASHNPFHSLDNLGICGLHRRGRTASEVVWWNIARLLEIAQSVSPERRRTLFGQVSWMCEGAGEKRFRETLDSYLLSLPDLNERQRRHRAQLLLALLDYLPYERSRYEVRLLLLASGAVATYCRFEQRVRQLADRSGCDHKRPYEQLREHIDQCLMKLLKSEHAQESDGPADPCWKSSQQAEDECTQGAIVVWPGDRKADAGLIAGIEQQCWDALSRAWQKTLIVRFPDNEQRICVGARASAGNRSAEKSVLVLLQASEVRYLAKAIQQGISQTEDPHTLQQWSERKAS